MIGTVLPFFYRLMAEDQHRFSLQGGRFLRLRVQILDPFHEDFRLDCDSNLVNTCDILGRNDIRPLHRAAQEEI